MPMAGRDLRHVRSKAQAVKRAEQELADAILRAVESGESFRDIAPYAGLSSSRVHQLAQQAKAERDRPAD
jgi:hypothetical protein